jgi:hypothetical protein
MKAETTTTSHPSNRPEPERAALPLQPDQQLELIDGMGKQTARMLRTAFKVVGGQCLPGRHCAHHGPGPFFCCRCGAEFTVVE